MLHQIAIKKNISYYRSLRGKIFYGGGFQKQIRIIIKLSGSLTLKK